MRFAPTGTAHQVSIVDAALARCEFPWELHAPDRVVPIEWADLSRMMVLPAERSMWAATAVYDEVRYSGTPHSHDHDHEGGADPLILDGPSVPAEFRNRVLGLAYYSGKVALDIGLEEDPELAQEVCLSELAHMIDFFVMSDRDRAGVWNALHPQLRHKIPLDADVEDGLVVLDDDVEHEHSWFDVGGYYSWVGEAWMGLFVRAFSPVQVTIPFPDHEPTDDAVNQMRRWWLPAVEPPADPELPPAPEPPLAVGCWGKTIERAALNLYPTPPAVKPEARVTSIVTGLGGAALAFFGAYTGSRLALSLAAVGLLLARYELYAIGTNRVPTITEILKGNGWPLRVAAIVLPVVAWVDHIGPGWVF